MGGSWVSIWGGGGGGLCGEDGCLFLIMKFAHHSPGVVPKHQSQGQTQGKNYGRL